MTSNCPPAGKLLNLSDGHTSPSFFCLFLICHNKNSESYLRVYQFTACLSLNLGNRSLPRDRSRGACVGTAGQARLLLPSVSGKDAQGLHLSLSEVKEQGRRREM